MMTVPLTLSGLEAAFKVCEKKATPHRAPDFEKLKAAVDSDPEVRGSLVFVEEHNTGYAGVLFRYMMSVSDRNGLPLRFQIDLLPGQIHSNPEEKAGL